MTRAATATAVEPTPPVVAPGTPLLFLGIGFRRSGTSWLNQQLAHHPQVWTPPFKELHYWDLQRTQGRNYAYRNRHLGMLMRRSRADLLHRASARAAFRTFVREHGAWSLRYFLGARSDAWYRGLFPKSGYLACGEITPAYIELDEPVVRAVRDLDRRIRVIILLRDPLAQIWSLALKRRVRDPRRALAHADSADVAATCRQLADRTEYWPAIARWRGLFGADQVHLGWYDDIVADKPLFLRRIAALLGVDPGPFLADRRIMEKRQNTTGSSEQPMPAALRRELAALLLPKTDQLAEHLGGHAIGWAEALRGVKRSG